MKKILFFTILAFALLYFAKNHIMGYWFSYYISDVEDYISNKYEHVLIADKKGDRSEVLTSELPEDIQKSLDRLFLIAKFYYGPTSRIYIHFENQSQNNSLKSLGIKSNITEKVFYVEMEGYKEWKDSFILNGDRRFYYLNNVHLFEDEIRNDGKYTQLNKSVFTNN